MSSYAQLIRRASVEERRAKRFFGRRTARPIYAWRVETTMIEIPMWARQAQLLELTQGPDHVWLKTRQLAYQLARMDFESGGFPRCDHMEIRKCGVCRQWLIGMNAERRRRLDESAVDGRKLPCDLNCQERGRQAA